MVGLSCFAEGNQPALQQFETRLRNMEVTGFQMDFQRFLDAIPSLSVLRGQQLALSKLTAQLDAFNPQGMCEQLAYERLHRWVLILTKRLSLSLEYRKAPQRYNGSFSNLKNGRKWYSHWLDSWLDQEVDVGKLIEIAHQEADYANNQLRGLVGQLPAAMDTLSDDDTIIEQFRLRERKVNQHFHRLFNVDKPFPPFNIARSTMPDSFPAPGYYVSENETFYFHLHNEQFELKSADWLFLHEALPGHHYQFSYPQKTICEISPEPSIFVAEGWGGYVETLGQDLGLFENLHSKHYALEWQRLRAVRVLIDTGLHWYNWSDEQAWDIWQQHIPGQADIFKRELNRIKTWPAQVNTYVYGKYMIENAIQGYLQHFPRGTLKQAHEAILNAMAFGAQGLQEGYPFWQLVAHQSKGKQQ